MSGPNKLTPGGNVQFTSLDVDDLDDASSVESVRSSSDNVRVDVFIKGDSSSDAEEIEDSHVVNSTMAAAAASASRGYVAVKNPKRSPAKRFSEEDRGLRESPEDLEGNLDNSPTDLLRANAFIRQGGNVGDIVGTSRPSHVRSLRVIKPGDQENEGQGFSGFTSFHDLPAYLSEDGSAAAPIVNVGGRTASTGYLGARVINLSGQPSALANSFREVRAESHQGESSGRANDARFSCDSLRDTVAKPLESEAASDLDEDDKGEVEAGYPEGVISQSGGAAATAVTSRAQVNLLDGVDLSFFAYPGQASRDQLIEAEAGNQAVGGVISEAVTHSITTVKAPHAKVHIMPSIAEVVGESSDSDTE